MNIDVVTAGGPDAATELAKAIASQDPAPSFASVHPRAGIQLAPLGPALASTPTLLATSSGGAMTSAGLCDGAAAILIDDPAGAYGVACRAFGGPARAAASAAAQEALRRADRPGEQPDLVWIASTPGAEEDVLAGIVDVVGPEVPIIGGSAADDDVGGAWVVGDGRQAHGAGVAVAALFPSRPLSFAYHNGYAPTARTGTVTRAEGRALYEIDGRSAADVYAEWTGGAVAIDPKGGPGQPILSASTLWPLGRQVTEVGRIPFHLLAHPATADPSGALHLFADIAEGDVVVQMEGSIDGLARRAGRVSALARRAGGLDPADIAGALVIYCGGCMMTVRDRLDDVIDGIRNDLGPAPFLGAFTFGEQGPIIGSGNRHGNLMISCVVFGR